MTERGAQLAQVIDQADDGLVWLVRQWRERCQGPLEVDQLVRERLAPLLAALPEVARDGYVKDCGKVLGVKVAVLKRAIESTEPDTSQADVPQGETGNSSPPGSDDDLQQSLAAFGERHFKTWFGAETYVGRETVDDDGRDTVLFVHETALKRFYSHVRVRAWDPRREQWTVRQLAKEWLDWPCCRTYERVVFRPQGAVSSDSYNLWRGFAVDPAPGDCSLYWEHVRDVVCDGDPDVYQYVRRWLAHSVQRVAELPEVALVLRGLQGTGKGWFVRPLAEIFGSHALTVQSMDHVSGRFNAHLKDVVLLFADEAFWGGDRSREGLIKALITEKQRLVEPKNKDAQQVDSFTRLILATNSEWPVAMDHDDRRVLVLDVGDQRKEDGDYFRDLAQQMANGGTAALMHDLLAEDLTGWHPRQRPQRSTGIDIKLRSASMIAQWWHENLENETNQAKRSGDGYDGGPAEWWDETPRLADLHDDYRRWCDRHNRKYVEGRATWGREMRRLVPHLSVYRPDGSSRDRRYVLGTVQQCRLALQTYFRCGDELWADPQPSDHSEEI